MDSFLLLALLRQFMPQYALSKVMIAFFHDRMITQWLSVILSLLSFANKRLKLGLFKNSATLREHQSTGDILTLFVNNET